MNAVAACAAGDAPIASKHECELILYTLTRSGAASNRANGQFVWSGDYIDCSDSLAALKRISQLISESGDIPATLGKIWLFRNACLVMDFQWEELRIAFDLTCDPHGLRLSVLGRTPGSRKFLRNALIGRAEAVADKGERHILHLWGSQAPYETVVNGVLRHVLWLHHYMVGVPNVINKLPLNPERHRAAFWWDGRPNFGDTIGPWLVQRLSSKHVVNVRGMDLDGPTLFGVGSVVHFLERPGAVIWGSGLIRPLDIRLKKKLAKVQPSAILAVRGELTRNELEAKLGWRVPRVFGDPAILLPRFYSPRPKPASAGKIAVVPHYYHKDLFKPLPENDQVDIVDVEQGMEAVVDSIANASHCISTSLHGVIIAQAYGVPWMWLRIGDNPLRGDRFKFEDFFSMFDRDAVSEQDIQETDVADLDFNQLALRAALPQARTNFDDLLDAFPSD